MPADFAPPFCNACSKAQRAAVSSTMCAPAVGFTSLEQHAVLADALVLLSLLKICTNRYHTLGVVKGAHTVL